MAVQDMQEGCLPSSIQCILCAGWVHWRCSGISVKLQGFQNFRCMCCANREPAKVIVEDEEIEQLGIGFEMVDRFCYLGDMIGAGGTWGGRCNQSQSGVCMGQVQGIVSHFEEQRCIFECEREGFHISGHSARKLGKPSLSPSKMHLWSSKSEKIP